MGASSGQHVLSFHRIVSSVFWRTRQFTSFSESKQIYWSIATANTFVLVFGNILNIFAAFFGLELPGLGLGFYGKVSVSKFEPGLGLGGYGLDSITGPSVPQFAGGTLGAWVPRSKPTSAGFTYRLYRLKPSTSRSKRASNKLVRIESMDGIWSFRLNFVKNTCLHYYSQNSGSFNFRGDNTRAFQRVSMNLNMTAGQAACQLFRRYTQNTLAASCVCWIVLIVT